MAATPPATALYRSIWRWRFYAGLFVLPLMVILLLSGALFLFKPQVDRWEERAFHNLPMAHSVLPSTQVAAARSAFPGARLTYYRLSGGAMTDVFVSPQGKVLGSLSPQTRIIAVDRKLHGQLLIGRQGSWIVELAASRAIVLIVTGLYLWWPKDHRGGRGMAGMEHGQRLFPVQHPAG